MVDASLRCAALRRVEGPVRSASTREPAALSEYCHALSTGLAPVVRAGGRGGHWEVDPARRGEVFEHVIVPDEQYETPFCLFLLLQQTLSLIFDIDAMASPLSALTPQYFTRENSIYEAELSAKVIFLNPAYGRRRWDLGLDGFFPVLEKIVDGDVRTRGCTLVALVPNFSHSPWSVCACERGRGGGV